MKVSDQFVNNFKDVPLLVFSPGRINLIGEHTDYNNGFVFPAAIDKGIIAGFSKTNNSSCKIIALDVNDSLDFTLVQLQPISNGGWKNYIIGVVAEIQKNLVLVVSFLRRRN